MNKSFLLFIFLIYISLHSAKAASSGDSLKNQIKNPQLLWDPSKDYTASFNESIRLILNDNIEQGIRVFTDTYINMVLNAKLDRVLDYKSLEIFSIILSYRNDELSSGEKKLGKMFVREIFNPENQSFDKTINQYLIDFPKSVFINRISVFFGSFFLDKSEENKRIAKLLELDPLCLGANTFKGEILKGQKKYDESIVYFSKAIEKFPEYSYAYAMRGLCNVRKEQFHSAFGDFTNAINLSPHYDSAYFWRGNARQVLKQYGLSIPDYHHAIEINPNFDLAYNNMALSFKYMSQPDSAVFYFDRAISINPTNPEFYANKGELYWDIKDYKKSIWSYDRAIDLDPNSNFLYDDRANAYYWDKETELALKDFKRAMEIDPNDIYAISHAAECCFYLNDYTQAIDYCNKSLKMKPENRRALMILGLSYGRTQDYPSQVSAFKRAVDLDSTNSVSLTNLGWGYYNINDFEKCIYYSVMAVKYDDKAYGAMFNYALATLRTGKVKESKNMYRKYLDIYTKNEMGSQNFNMLKEGVMEDLYNLIGKNIQVDDANDILKNIFGQ
jgi:tetratricopeptide (TPR) repeat protein